uniref:Uncharacterized protein n=1 Tax=Mus spicilegus TaxID=10103 RepID=A0A8C6G4D1_MUSSI
MALKNHLAPVEVTSKNMRFLITHNVTLNKFIEELKKCGMKYEDAVQLVRHKWRGDFNSKQLLYLGKYCLKMRLRFKDSNGHRNNCCIQENWGA